MQRTRFVRFLALLLIVGVAGIPFSAHEKTAAQGVSDPPSLLRRLPTQPQRGDPDLAARLAASPVGPDVPRPTGPLRPASNVPLTSGKLRDAVDNFLLTRALVPDLGAQGVDVTVEVLHSLPSAAIRDAVALRGGTVLGESEGLLLASLPIDQLVSLEHLDGVQSLREPLRVDVPVAPEVPKSDGARPRVNDSPLAALVVGEEVGKTNAAAWQSAGFNGAGVKIGLVDVFGQTPWNAAQGAGEVIAPLGTFCQFSGVPCNGYSCGGPPCTIYTLDTTAQHGTAVAEIIHEMAPGAQLYLASVGTTTDLQAAVNYFASQGVKIISRSLTSPYDGPGDGTGPIANVVNSAVAQGMAWFNAAGNSANDGSSFGGYWRGPWADANNNGWLEWAPGQEFLIFDCTFMNGLRWNDWGANRTDYDLAIYSSLNPLTLAYSSVNDQSAGAPPIEINQLACNGNVYYAAVRLFSAGSGTGGDILEFGVNGCCLAHWQNPFSASGPVADSASNGEITVGAIDPPLGTLIAPYSSWGPTNDNRIKPDLSAAACVASFTYAPSCFNGTSSATPAMAGAAALVLSAGLASTPAQLKTYLLNNASVDRGAVGTDNVYGRGELVLPSPPVVATPTPTPMTPTPTPTAPATITPTAIATQVPCAIRRADVDGDGVVSILDLAAVATYFGQSVPPAPAAYDQDGDLVISILDLATMATYYGQSVTAC